VRGDGGRVMTAPPSRPEARSRLGSQSANELGAPVASSIPEQLPGHEPASARKGYEDGNAFFWRYRCVEGSAGRHGVARGAMLFGAKRRRRLGQAGRAVARLLDLGGRHRGERRLRAWCRAGVARGRHVRAPGQPVQAAAVRQGQWSSGEERSTRCPHDRVVHRHHADTSGAASRAGGRTAGRDPYHAPSAQRRESRR